MSRYFVQLLTVSMVSCAAFAQDGNVIYQHSPVYENQNDPNWPYYTVTADQIFVHHGIDREAFRFEAVLWDQGEYVRPGDINLIAADEGAGPVMIQVDGYINAQHGQAYGARSVKQITLNQTGVDGGISGLRISGDLAEDGELDAGFIGGTCQIDGDITHDVVVDGLYGALRCRSMQNLTATGTRAEPPLALPYVTIDTAYAGTITCPRLHGLDINGALSGMVDITQGSLDWLYVRSAGVSGQITVAGTLREGWIIGGVEGTIDVAGDLGSAGPPASGLEIDGALGATSAHVHVGQNLLGALQVYSYNGSGTLGPNAEIEVDGDIAGDLRAGLVNGVTYGTLLVHGNMRPGSHLFLSNGTDVATAVLIEKDMSGAINLGPFEGRSSMVGGHIIIDGSFCGFIGVGEITDGGFVTTDFDGWDAGDSWCETAYVEVNGYQYYGNTPDVGLYVTTCLAGDLTNDGAVNGQDIDLFVMVLFHPDEYDATYPAIAGSRHFHGDVNCDQSVNGQDIDAFVLLLFDPEAYYATYHCGCQPGGDRSTAMNGSTTTGANDSSLGEYTPANVAAALMQNVAPERQAYVIAAAAELADSGPNAEFWSAVLAALP